MAGNAINYRGMRDWFVRETGSLRNDRASLIAWCLEEVKDVLPRDDVSRERLRKELDEQTKHMIAADWYSRVFKAWMGYALPDEFLAAYAATTAQSQVVSIFIDQYEFLFDMIQERVAGVCGLSWYNAAKRDSKYMSDFLGKLNSGQKIRELVVGLDPAAATARETALGQSWRERFFAKFGAKYDRGHFISHRQGGAYDINLFPQRADVNQGHHGFQKYRELETQCASTPGTLCFSRPIYEDLTWIPAEIEYGVIHSPDRIEIARFPNRP